MVVGCTLDHRIADAYSANMFMVAWARMSNSNSSNSSSSKPVLPSFRRSLLNPRRPTCIHPSIDRMYIPVTALPPKPAGAHGHNQLISRIYYVNAHQLDRLQKAASGCINIVDNGNYMNGKCGRTKLEAFSAFLWKMVAQCHAQEEEGEESAICKMGIVVDGRKRLTEGGVGIMEAYFGNVLSIPFGGIQVEELVQNPLEWVAARVQEFLGAALTREHFLGLIDWVEAHRPVPGLAKIYARGSRDGPAFVVSSGLRFPLSQVDFGWGRPAFASYHFPWGGDAGYVMPMPSPTSGWVVYMHLSPRHLHWIETQAPHLFTPFSFDCLLPSSSP